MEADLSRRYSGDLGRVLRSLASGLRDNSTESDFELAKKDAQQLYKVRALTHTYTCAGLTYLV